MAEFADGDEFAVAEYARIRERAEKAEAERDGLRHIIDCANTPLMRDVLAERDQLLEAAETLLRLKDGPRDAEYERAKPLAWENLRRAVMRLR